MLATRELIRARGLRNTLGLSPVVVVSVAIGPDVDLEFLSRPI